MTLLVFFLLAVFVTLCAWISTNVLQITGPKKEGRFYEVANLLYNMSSSNSNVLGITLLAFFLRLSLEFFLYRAIWGIFEDLHWAENLSFYLLCAVIALFRILYITSMQLFFLRHKRFAGRKK